MYVGAVAGGHLADYLRIRQILTTVATRKLFQTIGMFMSMTRIEYAGNKRKQLKNTKFHLHKTFKVSTPNKLSFC